MFKRKKFEQEMSYNEELDESLDDGFEDYNEEDQYEGIRNDFAEDVRDLLNSLIKEDDVEESFISKEVRKNHFEKHCLAGQNKKSTRSNIYYDFNDRRDYIDRERYINNHISDSKMISSLYQIVDQQRLFNRFFEGNRYIYFMASRGLKKSRGLLLHSFASGVTTNYINNTIDLLVLDNRNRTYTMYPVDSYYLETKLDNIFKRCSLNNYKFN